MKVKYTTLIMLFVSSIGLSNDELQSIKDEIAAMKQQYESKITALENRLAIAEEALDKQSESTQLEAQYSESPVTTKSETSNPNTFNPSISFIFDGRYVDYAKKQDALSFPGFVIGPESGPESEGFNIGESELIVSANIDDKFYGQSTIAFANDAGETEVEVEELFFQTLALNHGLTLKGGRFFSSLGYINEQHAHAWDFADAPLVYQAMLGGTLKNEGLQLSVLLPTEFYLEAGLELGNAQNFPSAGNHNGFGSQTAYINTGGDINYSNSWQLGLSYWRASVKGRAGLDENPDFTYSGDSDIKALDFVYKWSPNGNLNQEHVEFQFEYLDRSEDGTLGEDDSLIDYNGQQSGWYTQVAWLFKPNWRTGIRYDNINADNTGFNRETLEAAGLLSDDNQTRTSFMLEWLPSEFYRLRLQFNDQVDVLNPQSWTFQYTYSMGSHGAHQF